MTLLADAWPPVGTMIVGSTAGPFSDTLLNTASRSVLFPLSYVLLSDPYKCDIMVP